MVHVLHFDNNYIYNYMVHGYMMSQEYEVMIHGCMTLLEYI